MHTALKFISVLLEIISSMLFVRQHQNLIFTDFNSRGANTVNMPRIGSICVHLPSLTCSKSMFSLILHFYVIDIPVWFAPLTPCIIFVYCLKNNITLYLFLDVQNTLYITTRLIKYCFHMITSNWKHTQPLITFLNYIYHSTYLQVHMTCQGSCMFEG